MRTASGRKQLLTTGQAEPETLLMPTDLEPSYATCSTSYPPCATHQPRLAAHQSSAKRLLGCLPKLTFLVSCLLAFEYGGPSWAQYLWS